MELKEIKSLPDTELIWHCIEPIINQPRAKDIRTKMDVYKNLSESKRALFMFQVLYGHASNGMKEFFAQISYLAEVMDIWSAFKSAFNYLGDEKMSCIIDNIQDAYYKSKQDINFSFHELDILYKDQIDKSIKLAADYIRNNLSLFAD